MALIEIKAAESKLQDMAKVLPIEGRDMLHSILAGETVLGKQDSHFDPNSKSYMGWIEDRLASKHLGFLPEHQANGIWGGSTDKAFERLAEVYEVEWKGVIDQGIMRALLDGTKPASYVTGQPNSYQWIKQQAKAKGFEWNNQRGAVNIICIRGYTLREGKIQNAINIYNDLMFVCTENGDGTGSVKTFLCSCDPGWYYIHINPLNINGCASLMPNYQYFYEVGYHAPRSGSYPALNPINNGWVKAHRLDRNGHNDGKIYDAQYTNVHAGTAGNVVYAASAGCIVIWGHGPNGKHYQEFWALVKAPTNKTRIPLMILDSVKGA